MKSILQPEQKHPSQETALSDKSDEGFQETRRRFVKIPFCGFCFLPFTPFNYVVVAYALGW